MAQNQYLPGILLAQIFATFLVVFGHSYPFVTSFPRWLYDLQVFIYTFHMPLFVWISGYLLIFTCQSEGKHSKFIDKRFKKLIIPYIVLTLIAIIPKFLFSSVLNRGIELSGEGLTRTFLVPRENVWGHFWFLPMIFIMGVIGYCFDKATIRVGYRKLGWGLLTLILLTVYLLTSGQQLTGWFSIKDLANFGWCFSFGAFCASINFRVKDNLNKNLAIGAFCVALAIAAFSIQLPSTALYFRNAIIAMLMIYGILLICQALSSKFEIKKGTIITDTFSIFILSWPCQAVSNVVTERMFHYPYYVVMGSQLVCGIIGPIILLWLITIIENKYSIRWFSFSLGKGKPKRLTHEKKI